MIGIYCYTNKLDGKQYVGQSVNITRRLKDHKNRSLKGYSENSVLHRAIKKHGLENFNIEILEETTEEKLNEREIYWIKKLNCLVPNGYNVASGGNGCRIYYLEKDLLLDAEKMLMENKKYDEIQKVTGLSLGTLSAINNGKIDRIFNKNLSYPIKVAAPKDKTLYICPKCGKEKMKPDSKFCRECSAEERNTTPNLTKEQLLKDVEELQNFSAIGRKYGVSKTTIKKKLLKFGLSDKIIDYKEPKEPKKEKIVEKTWLDLPLTLKSVNKEDLNFSSGRECVLFIEKTYDKNTKAAREGLRRLIRGDRKSYLGYYI